MPFTPYHFGPGLLVKAVAPRWFSWTAFAATQVVIDGETLALLVRGEPPFHGALHTIAGGTLAGAGTAALMIGLRYYAERRVPGVLARLAERGPTVRAETTPLPIVVGGLIGGSSHALLDGFMHPDTSPLEPWRHSNPLLGLVDVHHLMIGCVVTGGIGLAWIAARVLRERSRAPMTRV